MCQESEGEGDEAERLVRAEHKELLVLVLVQTLVFEQDMTKWLRFERKLLQIIRN